MTRIAWLFRRLSVFLAAGCLLQPLPSLAEDASTPSAVHADPKPDARSGAYRRLVQKAVLEHELGHWAEAKSFFTRAHALYPNARTLRGMAIASYELRDYVETLRLLRAALSHPQQPLEGRVLQHAHEMLADAKGFIATRKLEVTPAHFQVKVFEREPLFDAEGNLMLNPGEQVLRFFATGYVSEVRKVRAEPGRHATLKVALQKTRPGTRPTPPLNPATTENGAAGQPQQPTPEQTATAPWLVIGLGGVGAAGVVAGGVLGILALDKKSAADEHCGAEGCNRLGLEQRQSARSLGRAAILSSVVGGALVTSALVLWWVGNEEEAAGQNATSMTLRPVTGLSATGLLWEGSW